VTGDVVADLTFGNLPSVPTTRSAELRAVLYREYALLTRNGVNLIFGIVPMLVYLLLVSTSLSNVVGHIDYLGTRVPFFVFLLPFVMTMSVVGASGTTGMALFQEEMTGVSIQLWSYPLRKSRFLLGKMIAALSLVLAQTALGLIVAVLIFSYPFNVTRWIGLLVALILTSVTFNGLFLALAVSIRSYRTFTGISSLSMLVLVFAAPALSTRQDLPTVLQWISWVNPVTYALDAMREVSIFGFGRAWPSLLVLCGLAIFGNAVAVRGLLGRTRNL
jgi:ABC-2 type transport system permease protein